MRKLFLSVIFFFTYSFAGSSHEEGSRVTLKYGLTSISESFSLNEHTFSIDFIGDKFRNEIRPKLDFSYVNIDLDNVDYLLQGALSAYIDVGGLGYEDFFPYSYLGLGYEYVKGSRKDFDSNFYLQFGLGAEITLSDIADDPRLITELRYMKMLGSGKGQDDELAIFIGVRIPLYGRNLAEDKYLSSDNPVLIDDDVSMMIPTDEQDEFVGQATSINVQPISSVSVDRNLISDEDGDGVSDNRDICPNTPSHLVVNSNGCSIKDEKIYINKSSPRFITDQNDDFTKLPRQRKTLDIHFKLNSSEIAFDSKGVIRNFVKAINTRGYSTIVVEGYTDNTGRVEANQKLSQDRANSVRDLMVQYGIKSSKIRAIGKGSFNPMANNDTAHGQALNRRIEVIVK